MRRCPIQTETSRLGKAVSEASARRQDSRPGSGVRLAVAIASLVHPRTGTSKKVRSRPPFGSDEGRKNAQGKT